MSTVPPSTKKSRFKSGELEPGEVLFSTSSPANRGMIGNELASTKREWAVKPPPGMESEPLDWDEITKL